MLRTKKELLIAALAAAPVSFLASSALVSLVEVLFPGAMPSGGWAQVEESVSVGKMVYALSVAPILENLLLWGVIALLGKFLRGCCLISALAALSSTLIHVLASGEAAYIAVFPGFFFMGLLILRAERRATGYWLSVVHHVAINAISVAGILLRGASA